MMRKRWNKHFCSVAIVLMMASIVFAQSAIAARISGYVKTGAGTPIEGIELRGLPGNPTTDANGYYTTPVEEGWSGTVEPVSEGNAYTFNPAKRDYRDLREERNSENYVDTRTYKISGYVKDAAGKGIKNINMVGLPGNTITDDNGFYSVMVVSGWSGTVTPNSPLYGFKPPSITYTKVLAEMANQNYVAQLPSLKISGYVKDTTGYGVPGVLLNGVPGMRSTNWQGYYTANVGYMDSIILTPQKSGYTFTPTNAAYDDMIESITDANFTAKIANGASCGQYTTQSAKSGNWSDPNTWTQHYVPTINDKIRINAGDTVTIDLSEVAVRSICNDGTVTSLPGISLNLSASDFIYNAGTIQGANGATRLQAGSDVILRAVQTVYNAVGATIRGGNGANDSSCNAQGGAGGSVGVVGNSFTNAGNIFSGNGGSGTSSCGGGTGYGADGGDVAVAASAIGLNLGTGVISAGTGGTGSAFPGRYCHRCWIVAKCCHSYGGVYESGVTGDTFYSALTKINRGKITGRNVKIDPNTIEIIGNDAVIEAEENLTITGGENATAYIADLKEGSIKAGNTVRIELGPGSTVDMQGLQTKAIQAGQKVEVIASQMVADEGKTSSDLIQSPVIPTQPTQPTGVPSDVVLTGTKQIAGKQGSTVNVNFSVINYSSLSEEFSITITDNKGWQRTSLPSSQVALNALEKKDFSFAVTLPGDVVTEEVITIKAASVKNPAVSQTLDITVFAQPESPEKDTDGDGFADNSDAFPNDPTEHLDSDNDGSGDNADSDDDNDQMPDDWETEHGLNPLDPSDAPKDPDNDSVSNRDEYMLNTDPAIHNSIGVNPDSSLTILGGGQYKMMISPSSDPNAVESKMQVTSAGNGIFVGDNGKTKITTIPDNTQVEGYVFVTGKNLTGTGDPSGIMVNPKPDGSYTLTNPNFPTSEVRINADKSYVVTDTDFAGMSAKINSDGSYAVSHTEFPGMTALANSSGVIQSVTDTAYSGMSLVVNGDGTYTVTSEEDPGFVVRVNADKTYSVTSDQYPGVVATFSEDGSYVLTDQDGNCYQNYKRGFSLSKFINSAAKIVSKVAGFVKKAATFISKVAGFVNKVATFVRDISGWIGTTFRIPLFSTISCYAGIVADVSKDVEDYSKRVADIAGDVQKFADQVVKATDPQTATRKSKRSDTAALPTSNCKSVNTLYTASGTVTDNDGKPISGVNVQIGDVVVPTDQAGNWKIFGLSSGSYTASAVKDGYTFKSVTFDVKDDNIDVSIPPEPPEPPNFSAGVFTADDCGIVRIDWLYDGGKYQGEFGIFSLTGMENLAPGSSEFIAEAVKRVLSNSRQGYLVFSDLSEGARFSGILGNEIRDWNAGQYKGLKSLTMKPGDQFATILVPNSTFASLAQNPGTTDSNKRPLFSLVSDNPGYGTHIGQMADINGMGKAFAYEDKDAATSDWDYNDLIVQITGAEASLPTLNSLVYPDKRSKREHRDTAFTDWRVNSELGKLIMAHIEAPAVTEDTLRMTVTLKAPATLLVYDPSGKVIGKEGGTIPGADFEISADGSQTVSLNNPGEGNYRITIQSAAPVQGTLTVKSYQGSAEISSADAAVSLAAHQTMTMAVPADSVSASQPLSLGTPVTATSYDFSGDGITDNADVSMIVKHWNSCRNQQKYDPFYDLNDDGCITVADVMKVLNAKTVK